MSLIGFRATALLLLIGLALSVPYGRAWLAGRPPVPPGGELVPAGEVRREDGATVIVLSDGRRRGGVRARELTPGWYALYTVFWRAPVTLGDYVLCGTWTLLGLALGRDRAPQLDDLHDASELREPSRIEF